MGLRAQLPSASAVLAQASKNFIMLNMFPWSVTATAGMPVSTHFFTRSGMRVRPSRREYSV
jgi:hypothetical protein